MFFYIYCNDSQHLLGNDDCILYADATALVYVGENLSELTSHVNPQLSRISEWCTFNKLALNLEKKSEFMMITNRQVTTSPSVYVGEDQIKKVSTVKYLGVFMDDRLKFQP